ncbi:LuxR C-terminal-related transcriptional regulator [Photobacterium sp. WH77]|uniref:LuxR C-terminal-related transcriptional regulator n=1 Tax=Photobacterium TaxID=657 RepID=UPI001EDAD150|nr:MULTISPECIES: LuxR C-terminal-related transcriptional regulator [Photobacterium]MCG2835955.1 LuxR C-terminal-related transcriptional regulator [Photobacterium sp. WH77]MCG2843368.1 LuxR C-terminal-related transcriptional regulator [Photobacterium sp. WH80]MDO6579995.1 LuxR C-terminal-related transcriptional regulator [Photobacterium sp. 2_MG-2023]
MSRKSYTRLALVSDESIQSSILKEYLVKKLTFSINCIKLDEISKLSAKQIEETLFILDSASITPKSSEKYLSIMADKEVIPSEVLINVCTDIKVDELKRWPNLVGVFYTSDSLDLLSEGLLKIQSGELWFSRKLCQELISEYRSTQANIPKLSVELTTREKEIMQLLVSGASNLQIAESLFVSENTVKTHLHNVFKKIKVKNRLQAFMWAKNHTFNSLLS